MNAKRRKELEKLVERIQGIIADLEVLRDEEQECFDNLPESLQESERGEKMEDNISNMDAVIDSLESASDELEDAISESY
jgi:exonuclease VII small subunit